MLVELLADGDRAADVRLDGGHARRRRRRFLAEDALHDPRAAQHRRGGRAVGGDFEHAGLRHQPAARAVLRQRHAAQRHALAPAAGRSARRAARSASRSPTRRGCAPADRPQQFGEEQLRLLQRRFGQQVVEVVVGIERRPARSPASCAGRASNRGTHRRTGATSDRCSSRSVCARNTSGWRNSLLRRAARAVRRRARSSRGRTEARRQRVIVEPPGLFLEADKLRRAQHRRVAGDHRVGEVVSLLQRASTTGRKRFNSPLRPLAGDRRAA